MRCFMLRSGWRLDIWGMVRYDVVAPSGVVRPKSGRESA